MSAYIYSELGMARLAGFEPATKGLGISFSNSEHLQGCSVYSGKKHSFYFKQS